MPSSLALRAADHAFASCPAFLRVSTIDEARTALGAQLALSDDMDAATLLEVWRSFEAGCRIGEDVRLGLSARLINLGQTECVVVGHHCVIRGCLRIEPEGRLDIAPFVYVGDGVVISAQASVELGEATMLAHGAMIFDNNSHPTNPYAREIQFRRMVGIKDRFMPVGIDSAPVQIGRRCWIGMNALVLKGVRIGDNTVVASGSVVVGDLPPNVVAGGNPAKVLRALTPDELVES